MKYLRKIISLSVLLTFMFSVVPAYAGTTSKTILTLKELQELALTNSRLKKQIDLNEENVYRNKRIAINGQDKINGSMSGMSSNLKNLADQSKELSDKLKDPNLTEAEKKEIQSQIGMLNKSQGDISGTLSPMRSNKKELKKQEDQMEDLEDDMEKNQSDYTKEIKDITALLSFNATKLNDTINLLEKNYEYNMKLANIEKIKNDIEVSTIISFNNQQVQASNIEKQLKYAKEQYALALRNINDLIGRDIDSPLKLVKYSVSEDIIPAPSYASVVDEVMKNSYALFQLDRDLDNLEDDYDDTDGSHQELIAKNNIELKELEKEQKLTDVQNELKNVLANYESSAKAYQLGILKFKNAEKEYNHAKVKYDVGLISQIEYQGNELTYLEALNNKVSLGYDYYLAREEFLNLKNGVSMNNYKAYKSQAR